MRNALLLLALCALSTVAFGQATPSPIGESAVWQASSDFLSQAHSACDKATPSSKFADCVINLMSKAGASGEAVSFTRELYKQSGGEVGIMSGFHKVGPVDVASVKYPLRNSNGLLLVNGKPRMVNAEDLKLLDQKGLAAELSIPRPAEPVSSSGRFPGRSQRRGLAQHANRQQRRSAVHHRIPPTQRLCNVR